MRDKCFSRRGEAILSSSVTRAALLGALTLGAVACSSDDGNEDTSADAAGSGGSMTAAGGMQPNDGSGPMSGATGDMGTTGSQGSMGSQTPGTGGSTTPGEDPGGDNPDQSGGSGSNGDTSSGNDGPPNINTSPTVAPDQIVEDDGTTIDCTMIERPATPLRRLTRFEYNNTVRDLLDTSLTPADAFPPDEIADGFTNNALVLTVAALHAEKYMEAAETLAAEAVSNLPALVTCDPAAIGEDACAREFAEDFARRAYRRAPEPEDIDALMTAFAAGAATSFDKGIEVMVRAALQSPHFLYRVEFTGGETPGVGMVRLNGYETASRLSYLLWGSAPDEALLSAAENGGLDTPEQIQTLARSMLQDPKARPAVAEFYRQWLGMPRLESTGKDPEAFPLWSNDMREAMIAENAAVVDAIIWGDSPTLATLLTEPLGLPQGPLADLYGMSPSQTAVALPADQQRSGVLTLPGFLAVQAHPDQTSPVLRGKFVRSKLMCTPPPPPPPEANITPPDPAAGGTARARFSAHSTDPECAACHQLMDPLGFPFENYDSIGAYRTTDAGEAIDVSGEMVASLDMDGEFNGVGELAVKLAGSGQVRDCVATQWYKYSMGRGAETGDVCSLSPLQQAFEVSGGDLVEMMVALTQTEAFLYRLSVDASEVSQ